MEIDWLVFSGLLAMVVGALVWLWSRKDGAGRSTAHRDEQQQQQQQQGSGVSEYRDESKPFDDAVEVATAAENAGPAASVAVRKRRKLHETKRQGPPASLAQFRPRNGRDACVEEPSVVQKASSRKSNAFDQQQLSNDAAVTSCTQQQRDKAAQNVEANARAQRKKAIHSVRESAEVPATPKTSGLKTLAELLSWRRDCDEYSRATVALQKRLCPSKKRLLVCHDMMGGYVQDNEPQGKVGDSNIFAIYHWHLIDTFVYFAHDLVSIPTPGWTNVAHKHGAKCLATFITEWDAGKKVCEEMLDAETMPIVVNQLASMMVYYNFDGYLVNIENSLSEPQRMVEFVDLLTKECHKVNPDAAVIWYDAVTISGHLHWQNELNENNKAFFDVSDGIFLNYTWEPLGIGRSQATARDRPEDVYVGIDVFGRNTYGGGGMTCYKALEAIDESRLSTAVFAPGWTFECLPEGKEFFSHQEKFWSQFERSFLPKRLATLPFSTSFTTGCSDVFALNGEYLTAPFASSSSSLSSLSKNQESAEQGLSSASWAWSNLSFQSVRHSVPSHPTAINPYCLSATHTREQLFPIKDISISQHRQIAFIGGSCLELRFKPSPKWVDESLTFQVLHTCFPLSRPVVINCVWGSISDEVAVPDAVLLLVLSKVEKSGLRYIRLPLNQGQQAEAEAEGLHAGDAALSEKMVAKFGYSPSPYRRSGDGNIDFLPSKELDHIFACQEDDDSAPAKTSNAEVASEGKNATSSSPRVDWHSSTFVISHQDLKEHHVQELRIVCTPRTAPLGYQQPVQQLLLGKLSVATPSTLKASLALVAGVQVTNIFWKHTASRRQLSFYGTISWQPHPWATCFFVYVSKAGCRPRYLGMAHADCFRVCAFPMGEFLFGADCDAWRTAEAQSVTFHVQPHTATGYLPPLVECTQHVFEFTS